jgi:hypothetical protein
MKEAMWNIDPLGDFTFSDSTDPNQQVLFSKPSVAPLLAGLVSKFGKRGQIAVSQIEAFVEDETAYLRKHMREALLDFESGGRLTVAEVKTNGKKRRPRTFPNEALVSFL